MEGALQRGVSPLMELDWVGNSHTTFRCRAFPRLKHAQLLFSPFANTFTGYWFFYLFLPYYCVCMYCTIHTVWQRE